MSEQPRKRKPEPRKRIDSIADFDAALDEIAKTDPAFAQEIRDRQQAVADCRRRAAANTDLLNRRIG